MIETRPDPNCPPNTMYLIPPLKYRLEWRADGKLYMITEPIDEWIKRCTRISNIGPDTPETTKGDKVGTSG